uniref:Uncharacterized protein n=1 Tax=Steinernema glaseri TaxID=37863 RepID=A0A1I7YTB8_9BILA
MCFSQQCDVKSIYLPASTYLFTRLPWRLFAQCGAACRPIDRVYFPTFSASGSLAFVAERVSSILGILIPCGRWPATWLSLITLIDARSIVAQHANTSRSGVIEATIMVSEQPASRGFSGGKSVFGTLLRACVYRFWVQACAPDVLHGGGPLTCPSALIAPVPPPCMCQPMCQLELDYKYWSVSQSRLADLSVSVGGGDGAFLCESM